MRTIQNHYSRELHQQLGYWGTWLPSNQLSLGDIGIMKDGVFQQVSTLSAEGISFQESIRSGLTCHEYSSKGAVDIQTKLSGEASLPNSSLKLEESGISIDFKLENAIYFKINRAKTSLIENFLEVEKDILGRFENDRWKKDWVFVSELVTAKESLVLVSNGKNAKVEFKVGANSKIHSELSLGVHHTTVLERNMAYKMISDSKITPLFKIQGVSSNWFGKKTVRAKTVQFEDSLFSEKAQNLVEVQPFHFD